MPAPKYLEDKTQFIGSVFNRWTIIGVVDKSHVLAQCECGSPPRAVLLTVLRRGKSKGCHSCCGVLIGEKKKTHGESKTRVYRIWRAMFHRCNNPIQESYIKLNIDMCEEWKASYESFRDWSLANGYGDDLEIDRIDNNLGYSPDNCRWATKKGNANNKANSVRVDYHGAKRTVEEVSKMSGIDKDLIYRRLKRGWTGESVVAPPKYNGENKNNALTVEINGTHVALSEIARRMGVDVSTVKGRYKKRKNVLDIFELSTWNRYTAEEKKAVNKRIEDTRKYYLGW